MAGWWRWALVSPDRVAPIWMVGVSASVNLPLHHLEFRKSRSSLLVPADPGGPGKRAVKWLVWWWLVFDKSMGKPIWAKPIYWHVGDVTAVPNECHRDIRVYITGTGSAHMLGTRRGMHVGNPTCRQTILDTGRSVMPSAG